MTRTSLCVLLVSAMAQASCALTSKGDALSLRYFNPLPSAPRPAPPASQAFELRLGQLSSASNLDERIAYRISSAEVGFYEDRRWTEPPEAYLRRALERDLFEQRKLTRIIAGPAPVLDVELTAFEEQKAAGKVRVKLSFSLRDERRSLLERSIELEQALDERRGADAAERAAQALVDALARAVETLGAEVVTALSKPVPG